MGQDAREWRRRRAWDLHQQGWRGTAIAQAPGASEAAVRTWLKRAREGGAEALKRHPPPGPTPTLTVARRAQVPAILAKGKGAEAYDFTGDVWTTTRGAAVIKRECGVGYHPVHVGRLVRHEGLRLQQPVVRATQRDEDAMRVWQTATWPARHATPRPRTARSSS